VLALPSIAVGRVKRPHVVFAGYQRNFADAFGRVTLVDTGRRVARPEPVGVRDVFVKKGFLTVTTSDGVKHDDLEDEFAKVENLVSPMLRTIEAGVPRTPSQKRILRAAIAMLLARSYAAEALKGRAAADSLARDVPRIARGRGTRKAITRSGEGWPGVAALEERLRDSWRDYFASGQATVPTIARHYEIVRKMLDDTDEVVLVAAPGHEFVTSDNPVILSNQSGLLLGLHRGVGVKSADSLVLPISRHLAVALVSEKSDDLELHSLSTVQLNNTSWRNAVRWVACHPSVDWATECAVPRSPRHT